MRIKTLVAVILIVNIALLAAACGGAKPGAEKVIKSTKSGDTTVTISSSTGEIKSGENELTLIFTDASGKPADVSAASLKFRMPAMGAMAEMNDAATLLTTDTAGKFQAKVSIEVAGSWEAMITFQGPRGVEQATMSVTAK